MNPRFFERQRFRQPWLWVLLLGTMLPLLLLFAYGAYRQLVLGMPWGDQPMPNGVLIGVTLFVVGTLFGTVAMIWASHLDVRVTDRELEVRFAPFHRKPRRFPLAEIAEAEARQYSPLGEYGGWGIRFGLNGMAYNVSGDRGVQLVLANGKRLLIGSQRADELAAAIARR